MALYILNKEREDSYVVLTREVARARLARAKWTGMTGSYATSWALLYPARVVPPTQGPLSAFS